MDTSSYGNFYHQELKIYLEERLEFSFLEKIPSSYGGVIEQSQEFFILLEMTVYDETFLASNMHTTNLLKTHITDKIIATAFTIKDNIYDEIQSEGQFNFDKNDFVNYVNFLLVLRDVLQSTSETYITDFNQYLYDKDNFTQYFEDNLSIIVDEVSEGSLKMVSPIIIATALKSFFPYYEDSQTIPIISRLVAIFSSMSKMLPFYNIGSVNDMPQSQKPYESMMCALYNNASFFGLDKNLIKNMEFFSKII